ncbi:fructose-amino acid permease-like protein [Paenibacillus larvae subsp. larvae]|uniref:Fructose-amino acid permease-like protein n=1 Tax=Paenibacillus larvae subsp. larvae TaxID=147375 RepID=A0A6C0QW52_9BACL|nr:fructose-amino acid permease-like protein [Paenibacillus larvae subsp. larvae]
MIVTLYPLLWAFNNSFKLHVDIISHPFALPTGELFTLKNYIDAWKTSHIDTYFFNSLYVSLVASTVCIVLASMVSYAVTRMRYKKLNKIVMGVLLLALMVPGGALLVPLYTFILNFDFLGLKIYDTRGSLILPYIAFGISLSVVIISAFIKSIPSELEEAGIMDGLSVYGLFWRIVLPLCGPALVTVFIINFLGNWNEFIMAYLLVSKEKLRTLPVGMVAFRDALNANYGGMFAATMYSIIPVAIIYAFLQNKIIEGLTAGSVKG